MYKKEEIMKNIYFTTAMSPLTGDRIESWPIILIVIAGIAIVAVLFFLKKK